MGDPIFYDPTEYVRRETLEVWIDSSDPRRHHVVIDFLPKTA
jgi:hypothetical protein